MKRAIVELVEALTRPMAWPAQNGTLTPGDRGVATDSVRWGIQKLQALMRAVKATGRLDDVEKSKSYTTIEAVSLGIR